MSSRALQALGYRTRLKVIDDKAYYETVQKAANEVQASSTGWITDYPSPSAYIQSLLDYVRDLTGFSDKAVEREIQQALKIQQTDPAAANELWARVDRMIVDRAAVVPMYNLRDVQLVSQRVGNYQYHPLWFTLLDQLWVR
jgi:peptide/nickel transport system substrate-binding protein